MNKKNYIGFLKEKYYKKGKPRLFFGMTEENKTQYENNENSECENLRELTEIEEMIMKETSKFILVSMHRVDCENCFKKILNLEF